MLHIIESLPDGVFGVKAEGVIGAEELDEVIVAIEERVRRRYDLALLLDFSFATSRSAGAREQQFNNRLLLRGPVHSFAFIGAPEWRDFFAAFLSFLGCEGRMFPPGVWEDALSWVNEAAERNRPL